MKILNFTEPYDRDIKWYLFKILDGSHRNPTTCKLCSDANCRQLVAVIWFKKPSNWDPNVVWKAGILAKIGKLASLNTGIQLPMSILKVMFGAEQNPYNSVGEMVWV